MTTAFRCLLIILILLFYFTDKVTADPRLDFFLDEFEIWKEKPYQNTPGLVGPWEPYLARPFYTGLTPEEKRIYLEMQEIGDCHSIAELDLSGFINLYPFLAPALERKDIKKIFERKISHDYSEGISRCYALSEINSRIIESAPTVDLPIEPNELFLQWDTSTFIPFEGRKHAFMVLYYLAICRDYLPAIKDILRFEAGGEVYLSTIDKLYLYKREIDFDLKDSKPGEIHLLIDRTYYNNDNKNMQIQPSYADIFGDLGAKTYYENTCSRYYYR